MRIAKSIIGPEQMQNPPLSRHFEGDGLTTSFAERFGESLSKTETDGAPPAKSGVLDDQQKLKNLNLVEREQNPTGPAPAKMPAQKIAIQPSFASQVNPPRAETEKDGATISTALDQNKKSDEMKTAGLGGEQEGVSNQPPAKTHEAISQLLVEPVSDAPLLAPQTMENDCLRLSGKLTKKGSDVTEGTAKHKEGVVEHKADKKVDDKKDAVRMASVDGMAISTASQDEISHVANFQAPPPPPTTQLEEKTSTSAIQPGMKPIAKTLREGTTVRSSFRVDAKNINDFETTTSGSQAKLPDQKVLEPRSVVIAQAVDGGKNREMKSATHEGKLLTAVEVQSGGPSVVSSPHAQLVPSQTGKVTADTHAGKPAQDPAFSPILYENPEHKALTATSTTLEVGIPTGSHGWLKVRAELSGDGGIHASVSSNSASETEMLRRELPTLTDFLHQEQVHVSSLAVHATPSAMDFSNLSSGGERGNGMGGGSTDSQGRGPNGEGALASRADDSFGAGIQEDDNGDGALSMGYAIAGGWLSIRA